MVLLKFWSGALIGWGIWFRIQQVPTWHTFGRPLSTKNKKYMKKRDVDLNIMFFNVFLVFRGAGSSKSMPSGVGSTTFYEESGEEKLKLGEICFEWKWRSEWKDDKRIYWTVPHSKFWFEVKFWPWEDVRSILVENLVFVLSHTSSPFILQRKMTQIKGYKFGVNIHS